MNRHEFAELNLPSQLLHVAIADARKLNRKKYEPNASSFHMPNFSYIAGFIPRFMKCEVCDAGAVIVGTLGSGPRENKTPYSYSTDIGNRLQAIDCLRTGNLWRACDLLWGRHAYSQDVVQELMDELGVPDYSAFEGWEEMDLHLASLEAYADKLEKAGF